LEVDSDYLSLVDESESARYRSRAVFSDVGVGVEVEEYDGFTLYTWRDDVGFDELVGCVEPFFPLSVDPALEMVKEEGPVRDLGREDYEKRSGEYLDEVSSELVYDPVADWREENRWSDYSLVQINLRDAKVIWDKKTREPHVRVYEMAQESDVFEKLFPELVDSGSAEEIVEAVKKL
jgi:hypothetical protein